MGYDRDRWARLLAEAAAEHASQPWRACGLCVQLMGITGAGISLVTPAGNRGAVCATDKVSARIEDLQFMLGEGAGVDAVRSGAPVLVGDLGRPGDVEVGRWPAFMEAAATAGVRAVFAFPLLIGAITVGALGLYRDRPGGLDSSELAGALMAADAAALSAAWVTGERAGATGAGIQQIKEAFLMLRARAFADGRPVADVARDVVQRRLRFSTGDQ